MSKWVIVVPGIMGSSLLLAKEEIWPPSPWDVLTGYDRIADLMNDKVAVGTIIRSVSIKSVYRSLIKDVEACGYHENGADRRLIEFPYDWRRSNSIAAERLAACLDDGSSGGLPDEITFVAHSMGGLVVRRLLEDGDFYDRPWFPTIRRLITFGTPHFGAPLAIARLQGQEKVLGIAGHDIVRLASDPRYPSSYELAGPNDSAFTLDVPQRGSLPRPLDRFAAEYVRILSLKAPNIAAGNEFWSHLGLERRPSGVEYFFVGGAAHSTTTACATDGTTLERTVTASAGDGTVPVASSIVRHIPHLYSRKEHSRVFEDRSAREALYAFLDAPAGVRPQAADTAQPVGQTGVIGLSVSQEDYLVDDPIEIVVSYATPIDQPTEAFWLERLHESAPPEPIDVVSISLDAPNVSNFVVTIGPHLEPGVYRLTTARPTDDPEPTIFRVLA
jgi:phospholipase A1